MQPEEPAAEQAPVDATLHEMQVGPTQAFDGKGVARTVWALKCSCGHAGKAIDESGIGRESRIHGLEMQLEGLMRIVGELVGQVRALEQRPPTMIGVDAARPFEYPAGSRIRLENRDGEGGVEYGTALEDGSIELEGGTVTATEVEPGEAELICPGCGGTLWRSQPGEPLPAVGSLTCGRCAARAIDARLAGAVPVSPGSDALIEEAQARIDAELAPRLPRPCCTRCGKDEADEVGVIIEGVCGDCRRTWEG